MNRRRLIGGALALPMVSASGTAGAESAPAVPEADEPRYLVWTPEYSVTKHGSVRWELTTEPWDDQMRSDVSEWWAIADERGYAKKILMFANADHFAALQEHDLSQWQITPVRDNGAYVAVAPSGATIAVHPEGYWLATDAFQWSIYNADPSLGDLSGWFIPHFL